MHTLFSAVVLSLLLLFPLSVLAQPQIEPSGEGGENAGPEGGTAQNDATDDDEGFGTPATCLGIRDGLLTADDASVLADAICKAVSRNGLPTGKVSEQTGGDTELRVLLTMNEDGEVTADWTLTEAGQELGDGKTTWPNYNAAMAGAPALGKEIAQAKHGPDLSQGFDESYYWTNVAFSFVVAAGVGEWGIGMSTSAHGQIRRFVIKLSGRFSFNPSGSLFTSDGALDLGANIISFGGGEHALYATGGVGLYALLAGANNALNTADVANRAGVFLALAAGSVFFRQSPINLYAELRASFPVWNFSLESNTDYIVPLMLELGVGF